MQDAESRSSPNDDVRMRGFSHRTTVEAALAWIDAHTAVLGEETVPIAEAATRALSGPIHSDVDVPGFRRAMMDGYAVQAADTHGATAYNPLRLSVVAEVMPGQQSAARLAAGQAIRIMTGSAMPEGSDAVLPAEYTIPQAEEILIQAEVSPGKHIGQPGEDVARGAELFQRGRILRPQDVGLLSSIGAAEVGVVRRPRVDVVVTGNELLESGSQPRDHQIVDANGPMLAALVRRDGGEAIRRAIVPDDPAAIGRAMQSDADVVLVCGGSSVGQEDHAPILLAEQGELAIHGIAMRPSSPTGMGRIGDRLVFLLPGNPVSCLCAYDFFAGRAIRRLGGRPDTWPYRRIVAPLRRKITSVVGRVDYARVRRSGGQIEPLAIGGASILSSTCRADGFVVVPADSEGNPPGAEVEVFLYDEPS